MALRFTAASCLYSFLCVLAAAPFSFFSASWAILCSLAATFSTSLLFFVVHLLDLSLRAESITSSVGLGQVSAQYSPGTYDRNFLYNSTCLMGHSPGFQHFKDIVLNLLPALITQLCCSL
jgi:hypothetical protein